MILVEPSVLQHKFIFKILCRSIDDYEIVKKKKNFNQIITTLFQNFLISIWFFKME